MSNTYFQFRKFRINQEQSGMKVTTDACLFGAWVASEIQNMDWEPDRILDIGTGTGLLALMLAQVTDQTRIDAVEINESASGEARYNFQNSPWQVRLFVHHTPVQNFNSDELYDLIICNPPFFTNSRPGAQLHKNMALHSSHLAMDESIEQVKKQMTPKGTFYLLYPEREMETFISMARQSGLFPLRQVTVRNHVDHPVFRVMTSFKFQEKDIQTEEIIIREKPGKYTTIFWGLLKEYYLEYNDPGW